MLYKSFYTVDFDVYCFKSFIGLSHKQWTKGIDTPRVLDSESEVEYYDSQGKMSGSGQTGSL